MSITAEFNPKKSFEHTHSDLPTEQTKPNRRRMAYYGKREPVPQKGLGFS
jgi:hypothetical protein